ncbi:hypothetical protein OEZ85_000105 [Tetradesmus obliquus]|uniref:Peptidase M41 domain-containing protein n=1 Tax=Tetradesmus obliquus TaxID=3088 RepID=A0ABY8USS7_TETOB|nr:hypothetical protein OEZ85_000105 [Tetradesmus obliquus]
MALFAVLHATSNPWISSRQGRPQHTHAVQQQRCCHYSHTAGQRGLATTVCRSASVQSPSISLSKDSTLTSFCQQLDSILADASGEGSNAGSNLGSNAEKLAVQLAEAARAQGLVKAFGRGLQVPKRIYTIDELRLNKVEPEKLLSPTDDSLNYVRNVAQGAAAAGLAAVAYFSGFDGGKVFGTLLGASFLLAADQVANMGGGEALIVDTLGRVIRPAYQQRVTLHEAGHFLIAYLVGLLPRDYTMSSLDAFLRYRALNVQAGCHFCDGGFEGEVAAGRLSSSSLDRFSCVALAGVVTEYLRFGQAEGGVGDVAQLDQLLRALQFTQKKADGQVRWAVLNVAALLRRHADLHDKLAAAMAAGASVGSCVALIEKDLAGKAELLAAEAGSVSMESPLTSTATSSE